MLSIMAIEILAVSGALLVAFIYPQLGRSGSAERNDCSVRLREGAG